MQPESYDPLSPLDLEQFDALVSQEGFTIDGQVKRLKMIEPMIRQRMELREKERRRALAAKHQDEREIDRIIRQEFQYPRFEYINVRDRVAAVVVEKSGLPIRTRAAYTVMLPAHVDTIVPTWSSYDPAEQHAEPDPRTGRISGLGVWDEGQAVANAISVMADLQVPDGMRVYGVFVRGEETPRSLGANALISQWAGMEEVDLVLSSEIGPIPFADMPSEGDRAMRYVTARPGRARLFAKFKVTEESTGHGSIPGLPNAQAERDRFQVWMEDVFTGADAHGFDYGNDPGGAKRMSLAVSHPLLGDERIDAGYSWRHGEGTFSHDERLAMAGDPDDVHGDKQGMDVDYVLPQEVHSKFYVRLVPPSDLSSMLEDVKSVHAHIGRIRRWAERGIMSKVELFEGEQSYAPFAMPPKERNGAVRVVHDILTKVAGAEAVPVRGDSVADENLYAAELRAHQDLSIDDPGGDFVDTNMAVLSIPPIGSHAHNPNEFVSAHDMARVRHALMRLLRDPDGLSQLARIRT